ncbi:MAG: prohibitin family protein [Clostridia bacterium]|nr:prohibitin family protein [Clostridia bacterium]
MAAFIFAILFLAIGIIAGVSMRFVKVNSKTNLAKFSFIPYTVGAILFVICFATSIFVSVPTGHTGVVTVFGRVNDEVLDAGIHVKAPWENVINMDNRVQKATVTLQCFSSDIQEVECKYTLNYQIKKANAQEIYKSVGISYYDTVITPNVAESVKTIMAHYTAENLIGNRDELAANIEDLLGTQLERYNVEVVSTAIEDMDFTNEFTAAVEAKQVAVQNKLRAQTEQEQKTMEATQEAERSKIEAAAKAEIAKIQAEADREVAQIGADSAEYQGKKEAAIALQRLASINGWTVVLTDEGINELYKADGTQVTAEELKIGSEKLIEYYYIEQWNGILPETFVGDGSASTIILGKGTSN